ncbi:hypothetical protein TrST_g14233 [Triparma strigata]|uniref:TauD/TfdA-like domain-containing protein n=1 Tax=Triparma strigata TaxID=1606541 RepID=A0A9W7B126_9STRA|nr:hypothetical protein TrST_g14233 [Triparma strigata]
MSYTLRYMKIVGFIIVGCTFCILLSSTCINMYARALTPAVGATLSLEDLGLSLSSPEDHSAAAEAVHQVVMDHGVCFLRRGDNNNFEDDEDDKALVSFARHFGELEKPHPIYSSDPTSPLAVVANDAEHPPDGAEWHTDCSWSEAPPFASVLWPRLLPAT